MFRVRMDDIDHEKWLKKLAGFVMTHMSTDISFYEAFAKDFSGEDIRELDKLTDELFIKKD